MNFGKILKTYFQFVLKYKLIYFGFLFCVISTAIIWNIVPLLYKSFISLAQNGDFDNLYFLLFGIALILIINLILGTTLERFQYILKLKVEADAKTKAFCLI